MGDFNREYWDNRYCENETPWDIGYVSTPIKTYIDQLKDKSAKILIPGGGNSYEAEFLWKYGFKNTYILDFAKQPLYNFKKRVIDFPEEQLLNNDFFEIKETFDLILEQTFFCAINPELRIDYVEQMFKLLKPKGKLVGLLFQFPLSESGPPFGGNISEYRELFKKKFEIRTLEIAINSVKERQGKELFFIFEKKI